MEIKSERYGQALILRCKGELTGDSLEVFVKEVERQMADNATDVVLSLEGVPFIDSAALEYLLDLQDELMSAGGQISLTNVDENVAKILEITRLDAGFEILPDVVDAVKVM
jgi:anti-sigma B factor antagonist